MSDYALFHKNEYVLCLGWMLLFFCRLKCQKILLKRDYYKTKRKLCVAV